MEKKKLDAIFEGAKNTAKGALNKANERAVMMIDQNDDGKLDMDDVSLVAGAVGGAVKKGYATLKESAEENRNRMDRKLLQPIFPEDLEGTDFYLSKLIRIVDKDKKRADSDACRGSIGYVFDKGDMRVVNLYRNSIDAFGLSFYPDSGCEFYYVDPTDRDSYISMEEYFVYLKDARVNELQQVAQELGAKYFKVTYLEDSRTFSEVKGKAKANVANAESAEAEHAAIEKQFSKLDIAAEMTMLGHTPQMPKLTYLSKDTNVQNLIKLRMSGCDNFQNYKKTMRVSNSSGIKETDAAKIDAVLKGLKASTNINVASEARKEQNTFFEYEIEF